jgi:hypothetical protein
MKRSKALLACRKLRNSYRGKKDQISGALTTPVNPGVTGRNGCCTCLLSETRLVRFQRHPPIFAGLADVMLVDRGKGGLLFPHQERRIAAKVNLLSGRILARGWRVGSEPLEPSIGIKVGIARHL